MLQSAQERRGDHLAVFGKAMPDGHGLIRVGHRLGNARSQAGVGTTAIVVRHPLSKRRVGDGARASGSANRDTPDVSASAVPGLRPPANQIGRRRLRLQDRHRHQLDLGTEPSTRLLDTTATHESRHCSQTSNLTTSTPHRDEGEADPRQNSSELILAPAPARIRTCSSC